MPTGPTFVIGRPGRVAQGPELGWMASAPSGANCARSKASLSTPLTSVPGGSGGFPLAIRNPNSWGSVPGASGSPPPRGLSGELVQPGPGPPNTARLPASLRLHPPVRSTLGQTRAEVRPRWFLAGFGTYQGQP